MRFPFPYCLAAALLLGARPAPAQQHPMEHPMEHPSKMKETKLSLDQLADGIEAYIQDDAKLKGGEFLIYDPVDKKVLDLTLVKVHRDKLSGLGDGVYFACTDMKASDDTLYDLDFFMKQRGPKVVATEISIHKKAGQARYGWKEENGVWSKVKI